MPFLVTDVVLGSIYRDLGRSELIFFFIHLAREVP